MAHWVNFVKYRELTKTTHNYVIWDCKVGDIHDMVHRFGVKTANPGSNSRSTQCSTTGVTKAVVCTILSVGWCL